MRIEAVIVFAGFAVLLGAVEGKEPVQESRLQWGQLPPLPDMEGFAGMFAGVSNGSLIAAGGANFPAARVWEGGKKEWYDSIYVLDKPTGKWRMANERLPRSLAYGGSASWNDAVICAGGSDGQRHFDTVFALRLVNDHVQIEPLPSLPEPCADMCCGLVGSQFYIAGGTKRPGDTTAMHTFWRLDLAEPKDQLRWEILKPWPGPERSHAVAAVLDESFFVMSGFRWEPDLKGDAVRTVPFLSDAYRYTPRGKAEGLWQRVSDLPRAVGAAPSPAMTFAGSKIAVIGGTDDTIGNLEARTHPGFLPDVFVYDSIADQWTLPEKMPVGASRVTAPSATWHDQYIVINGERAPGRRSPDVYTVRLNSSPHNEQEKPPGK